MRYPLLRFSQPAGEFFLTTMPATEVISMARADPREYDPDTQTSIGGIQRWLSRSRVREIADYSRTVDAAFPTAVILAVKEDDYELEGDAASIEFTKEGRFANVVDGQHRLRGLEASGEAGSFQIPVVLLLGATIEQQALLFSTINGKQTKVSASLIYDLFGLTRSRNPQRVAHEVARALNVSEGSPWRRRLKMLGRKSRPNSTETVTQGTFVREVLSHLTSDAARDFNVAQSGGEFSPDPSRVLNEYFVNEEDEVIVKLLINVFNGQRDVWTEEWDNPEDFILTKTVGFTATMRSLPALVAAGQRQKTLTRSFFRGVFERAAHRLDAEGKRLTSNFFASSGAGVSDLSRIFKDAAQEARTR